MDVEQVKVTHKQHGVPLEELVVPESAALKSSSANSWNLTLNDESLDFQLLFQSRIPEEAVNDFTAVKSTRILFGLPLRNTQECHQNGRAAGLPIRMSKLAVTENHLP